MILFKYINAKYGLEAILESKLKVSIPSELNDPFELVPRNCGKWTQRKVKKYLKDKQRQNRIFESQKKQGIVKNKKQFKEVLKDLDSVSENLLVKFESKEYWEQIYELKKNNDNIMRSISFSSDFANQYDEILLWSHYGDNHCGMRLHYDSNLILLPSFELRKINYSPERASVDFTLDNTSNDFVNQLVNALVTKSECWSYEKEFRLFIDSQYCDKIVNGGKSLFFAKIPKQGLVRIDLGLNCNDYFINELKSLVKINTYSHMCLYKAELDKEEFKLNYVKIN